MTMTNNGLSKLTEEMGEAAQIVGKMLQYPMLQTTNVPHPDGTVLRTRLEEELGYMLAAARFVAAKLQLNLAVIDDRAYTKQQLFNKWDRES